MTHNIKDYLNALREALSDYDQATVQDALSDAEEHLRTALESHLETNPETNKSAALESIIQEYGTPEEVAGAYIGIEDMIIPTLARVQKQDNRSFFIRFFGVLGDPKAWGAIIYMFLAFITGILYFTWAVTGISLSIGFMVMIIGLPFVGLFLLSLKGIALVEGRIVEALLGVRMPRRPTFSRKDLSLWERLKALLKDTHTWKTLLYMIIQFPLGTIYFCLFVTLISLGLSGFAAPIVQTILGIPIIQFGTHNYYIPTTMMPLWAFGGVIILTANMHLAKLIGRVHGAIARGLLISE
ncbi:MAG: sensor domain-containing protein [Anaerolineaceae bacterium]|nr:sensor domain-containing protein [Anaerolineaceae bacterium]